MRIKGGHTRALNLNFGFALLCILSLLVFSLWQLVRGSQAMTGQQELLDTSSLAHLRFKPALVELQVNQENYNLIKKKRATAMDEGLLYTSRADFVPADMRISQYTFPIDIRLKGDLLDHLVGDKWSYRLELRKDEQWRNMSSFSIHHSAARSHIAEWYMHQLFKLEGIMSTSYDFINVEENGKRKGVYAYEEHFTDQLLLAHKKPIGPILKHNDDAYWNNVQKDVKPFYWTKAMDIDLFNKNNKGDEDFMKSYEFAKSLLSGFLNEDLSVEQVFDVDKMAKYFALMELSHAFHSQQITNIRFYFNPLTARLEPIAFDCFGVDMPAVTQEWAAAGESINPKVKPREGYPYGGVYMHLLFQDRAFVERYLSYLYRYTNTNYLKQLEIQLDSYVDERELFIQQDPDYKDYQFSFVDLFKKASFTRKKIVPLQDYSIKLFTKKSSRRDLLVQSFHYFPLELIGFGADNSLLDTLHETVYLEAYNKDTDQELYSIINKYEHNQLFYAVLGIDSIFSVDIQINNYPELSHQSTQSSLLDLKEKYSINIEDGYLSFPMMDLTIDEALTIPKGFIVSFKAGQQIKFTGSGCFISYSPIQANGTQDAPISFTGEAKKGQAILIVGEKTSRSVFDHCRFTSLHSIQHEGLQSRAGLTLSSAVDISNCSYEKMVGESAVFFVDAEVNIHDVTFANCTGNGLTCDFTSGDLRTMQFESIGGDAVKVNYSDLNIVDSHFDQISGEAITAHKMNAFGLRQINIRNSFEGIGIEQSESISIQGITMENVHNGLQLEGIQNNLTHVDCVDIQFNDIQHKYLVDQYSTLLINHKRVF